MQIYAKNRKIYFLTQEDVEHKTQPAALLSFLVTGSGQRSSIATLYVQPFDLGSGPRELPIGVNQRLQVAHHLLQTQYSVPGTQQSPDARASF